MNFKILLVIFITFFNLTSCSNYLKPNDYIVWVNNTEHGLIKEYTKSGYLFKAYYRPSSYLALKELADVNISDKLLDSVNNEYDGSYYFDIKIFNSENPNEDALKSFLNNEQEYYARMEYLSSYVNNDFKLVHNSDTMRCMMHHFERTYKLSPNISLSLAFEKEDIRRFSDNLRLLYKGPFSNDSLLIIEFTKNDLNNIPQLKL